jgi:exopolysaccharide production protein ExoY
MTGERNSRVFSTVPAPRRGDGSPERVIESSPTDTSDTAAGLHALLAEPPGLPLVQSRPLPRGATSPPKALLGYPGKRAFDVAGSVFFGLLLSPLILAIVILIRLEGEPVLFRHKRVGRSGKVFHCLKFRTMVRNAEQVLRDVLREHPELRDEWTQNHKLRADPRITRVGRLLRLTSLDELPQLWNILLGDMSLVGPRPIVRAEILRYGRNLASYLAVKPGLTGLWQVKGRSDTTYRRRVAMDIYYVQNQSVFLDTAIVAATFAAVVRRAGAY